MSDESICHSRIEITIYDVKSFCLKLIEFDGDYQLPRQ